MNKVFQKKKKIKQLNDLFLLIFFLKTKKVKTALIFIYLFIFLEGWQDVGEFKYILFILFASTIS